MPDATALHHLVPLRDVNAVVAGSAALHRLLSLVESTREQKWNPENADMFFLGQEVANRVSFMIFDVVQSKEKTVEELLLNFDLPICRVAMNFAYDFFVSVQCLAAIHTHRQNVPKYLRDKLTFKRVLDKHVKYPQDVFQHAQGNHEYLYNRFCERVKKYQSRGYGVNWIDTDVIIPWVKNRFHYGEWLFPKQEEYIYM